MQRPPAHQPIPADAEKVFSGILYDVYHWQQQRFDGTTATYERLKRRDSVVIVPVTTDGKIVLTKMRQPGTDEYLAVPCGGVDAGEEPEKAAARELFEETGYESQELELWFSHQVEHRVDWAIFVFIARGCHKKREPAADGGEQSKPYLVSFEEFLQTVIRPEFQNINLAQPLLAAALDPAAMAQLKKRFGLTS